jgi:glutamyl-tRNA synthetase
MINKKEKVRVRFAPSPTGYLHIGSLRSALFNYLTAKSLGGDFILRIEDTDQKREVAGAVDKLIDALEWVSLSFDEGPDKGGKYAPYLQSQRMDIYQKYAEELLKKGGAYYCFCSAERLDRKRKDQEAKKLPPRYDRACRDLTLEEVGKKIKNGETFVLRQRIPSKGEVIVYDELRGEIKFKAEELEDHVLIKSDGMPTYQFANVVDDHTMKITHVLRGDEWISSFPKNILLYKAFKWTSPKFIHMPLILNKEGGGKLSKRQGDVTVEDYRSKGYLPEALINFCVLLGWRGKLINNEKLIMNNREGKGSEVFSLKELEKVFNYKDIGTSPAVFDLEKLDSLNGYYIRQMDLDKLTKMCVPYLEKAGLIKPMVNGQWLMVSDNKEISFGYLKKVVKLEQERLKKLSEIGERTEFFFNHDLKYEADLLIWKSLSHEEVKNNLEKIHELLEKIPEENWTDDSINDAIITYLKAKELKVGDYLWPLRVSLTGLKASPGPFEVAEVLGRAESLSRVQGGVKKLSSYKVIKL